MIRPIAILSAALFFAGCASFALRPVQPAYGPDSAMRGAIVTGVTVGIAERIQGKKRKILVQNDVPGELERNLMASFAQVQTPGAGEGLTVQVQLTAFRLGGYGPSRLHAEVRVVNGAGDVVESFAADSTTMRGGSGTSKLKIIAQDVLRQVADGV